MLALFGAWLFLECTFSLLATCEPSYGPVHAQERADQYCSAFQGPLSILARAFLIWFKEISEDRELVNSLATVAIALFTFTLWRSTHKLWGVTRDTLQHAQKTAQWELRAYVNVTNVVMQVPGADDINYRPPEWKPGTIIHDLIRIHLKNAGQTPASNVRTHVNWYVFPFGERVPVDFAFPDFNTHEGYSVANVVLASGDPIILDTPVDVRAIIAARSNEITLLYYGHVDYRDVFKNDWQSRFAFIYHWADGLGEAMTRLDRYNDAD